MKTTGRRELREIAAFLDEWSEIGAGWIHLATSDQDPANQLVEQTLALTAADRLTLEIDLTVQPLNSRLYFRQLLRRLTSAYPQLTAYFNTIPPALRQFYLSAIKNDPDVDLFDKQDYWEPVLLKEMLRFLAVENQLQIVVRGLPEQPSDTLLNVLNVFGNLASIPLLLITTGVAGDFRPGFKQQLQITPARLSVKEAQQVVARQLETGKVNAQLITNAFYVKCAGRENLLRFMVEGYGRPVLQDGAEEVVTHQDLRAMRPDEHPDAVFAAVLAQQDKISRRILSFLCRLEDAIPAMYLDIILRHYSLSRKDLAPWLTIGIVEQIDSLGESYYTIGWTPWRNYLRKHTTIEELTPLLNIFKDRLNLEDLPSPLVVSQLYAETGDLPSALKFAFHESQLLLRFGEEMRALDRLAFIRRNQHFVEGVLPDKKVLLKVTAEAQQAAGLSENAFESYRELRDLQQEDQPQEWLSTTMKMARTLFRMDALAESRYLLKDLQSRKQLPADLQAEIAILSGELEENSGHPKYALRQYQTALKHLSDQTPAKLLLQLYSHFKSLFASEPAKLLKALEKLEKPAAGHAVLSFYFVLERVTLLAAGNQHRQALVTLLQGYRGGKSWLPPRLSYQMHVQLADLYAFFGKYYLARHHFNKVLEIPLLLTTSLHQARVLLDQAIVNKEIGAYRRAFDLLELLEDLPMSGKAERYRHLALLHRGHLYLLVQNPLRAREALLKCSLWAKESREDEITLQSALYLCSYEIHHGRAQKAEDYLKQAEALLEVLPEQINHLNAEYYRLLLLMKREENRKALKLAKKWAGNCEGLPRMQMIAQWMLGRLYRIDGDYRKARACLEKSLADSRRFRLAYPQFQVLKSIAHLESAQYGQGPNLDKAVEAAHQAFRYYLSQIGDEILQKQIEESREYESLARLAE